MYDTNNNYEVLDIGTYEYNGYTCVYQVYYCLPVEKNCQFILTFLYIVESKCILPWDVNTVWTNFVVSKFWYAVDLISRIGIFDTIRYFTLFSRCVFYKSWCKYSWVKEIIDTIILSCLHLCAGYLRRNSF